MGTSYAVVEDDKRRMSFKQKLILLLRIFLIIKLRANAELPNYCIAILSV